MARRITAADRLSEVMRVDANWIHILVEILPKRYPFGEMIMVGLFFFVKVGLLREI